jgi:cysteinyl-tRNA synthetase
MEEHRPAAAEGPCDRLCSQGGLDLVRKLRERFPDLLFVMQNATSAVTREGKTGGLDFPFLLDGIAREEAFTPPPGDRAEQADLTAWKNLGLRPGGRPFVVLTEDYVGSCANSAAARAIYGLSRAAGFSPYATDRSSGQMVVCYWGF